MGFYDSKTLTLNAVVHAFVFCTLDYCNILYYNLHKHSYINYWNYWGGFLLLVLYLQLVLYLLLALLLQFFSLFVTLLVGPLSHLYGGPICSLIFLVLWCSMTVVLFIFLFLLCLSYLFIPNPHWKKCWTFQVRTKILHL